MGANRLDFVARHANHLRIPVEVHKRTEVKAASIHQLGTEIYSSNQQHSLTCNLETLINNNIIDFVFDFQQFQPGFSIKYTTL